MSRWLLLLALLASQDADVATLVERLADPQIQVRERATQRLLEIGVPARPALEKAAKGGDPETAARARSVLGEITLAEQRKSVLGPTGRITLATGDYTLDQVASAVRDQTSIPLALPEGMGAERVRIGAAGVPAWDFLALVSRAHGGLRLSSTPPRGHFALDAGAPLDAPSCTSGPFRVWIERLKVERRRAAGRPWERGCLLLAVAWQPNVRPIGNLFYSPPGVHLSEIRADDGTVLDLAPRLESIYGSFELDFEPEHVYRHFVEFAAPPLKSKRLTVVRGHVDVRLPYAPQECVFDKPETAGGQSRRAGPFTIRLKEFRGGAEPLAILSCWRTPTEDAQPAPARDPVDLNVRLSPEEILLVDDRGVEHPGSPKGTSWDHQDRIRSYTLAAGFPSGVVPVSLKVRFLATTFERRVEFEFKDVELP